MYYNQSVMVISGKIWNIAHLESLRINYYIYIFSESKTMVELDKNLIS